MSILLVFLIGIVLVCVAVLLPILLDLLLSVLEFFGFQPWRSLYISKLMLRLSKLSDSAEYLVMMLVLGFVTMPIYFHFFDVMPFFLAFYPSDALLPETVYFVLFHLIPSIFLNGNMLFHFYRIVTMSPGTSLDSGRPVGKAANTASTAGDRCSPALASEALGSAPRKMCETCERPRPARAHHCYTCDACVLQHDHHCVFAANCIGLNNTHHFFLFSFFCALSAVYAVYIAIRPYIECTLKRDQEGRLPMEEMEALCLEHNHHRVLLMLAVFSAVVLVALFGIVLHLALVGETMHEFIRRLRGRKPKKLAPGSVPMRDLGAHRGGGGGGEEGGAASNSAAGGYGSASWRANMEFLFGPARSWWRWLIPLAPLHRSARKVS